jgi:hypothetical protein
LKFEKLGEFETKPENIISGLSGPKMELFCEKKPEMIKFAATCRLYRGHLQDRLMALTVWWIQIHSDPKLFAC